MPVTSVLLDSRVRVEHNTYAVGTLKSGDDNNTVIIGAQYVCTNCNCKSKRDTKSVKSLLTIYSNYACMYCVNVGVFVVLRLLAKSLRASRDRASYCADFVFLTRVAFRCFHYVLFS